MDWVWTEHIEKQLVERKISKQVVKAALANPDQIIDGKHNRTIYHKIIGHKLLRIIAEENKLSPFTKPIKYKNILKNKDMRIYYSADADALYIRLKETEIDNTDEVSDDIIMDYDKKGNVVGIEILSASQKSDVHQLFIQAFEKVMVESSVSA